MKTIFERFPENSREQILEAFSKLSLSQKELYFKAYGPDLDDLSLFQNLTPREKSRLYYCTRGILSRLIKNSDIIEYKRKIGVKNVFERFSDYTEEEVQEAFGRLCLKHQQILTYSFGNDLKDVSNYISLTDDERARVDSPLKCLKKALENRDYSSSEYSFGSKNHGRKTKSLFERFPNSSKEEILAVIDTLDERDKQSLRKGYGSDYDDSSSFSSLSKRDKQRIQSIISNKIKNRLESSSKDDESTRRTLNGSTVRRRFNNRKQGAYGVTNSVISDLFSKINYISLSREEENNIIKIIKMYYYDEASDEMKEKYFDYYVSVFPHRRIKEKYESASADGKRRIIERAISEAGYYREKFVENNQLLVRSIASKYSGYLPLEDAMQIGNFGLIKAIEKFDIDRGNKFSTYATYWIFQGISRYISKQHSSFKVPVHLIDKIHTFNLAEERLIQKLLRMPTLEEISMESGLSLKATEDVRNYRNYLSTTSSLDLMVGERGTKSVGDFMASEDMDFSDYVNDELFYKGLMDIIDETLSEREKQIIYMRFGLDESSPMTLDEIGRIFGITCERVRQIEMKALEKLRRNEKLNNYYVSEIRDEVSNASEITIVRELVCKSDISILDNTELMVINLIYGRLYSVKEVSTEIGMSEINVVKFQKSALVKLRNYYASIYGKSSLEKILKR